MIFAYKAFILLITAVFFTCLLIYTIDFKRVKINIKRGLNGILILMEYWEQKVEAMEKCPSWADQMKWFRSRI